MYVLCDYLPGFTSHSSFKSNEVLLTSYFSLFASYLSLIITRADERIGRQCIRFNAEKIPESLLQLSIKYGHAVIADSGQSYAITVLLSCPSFPSPGDQFCTQRSCLMYETDLW